LQLFQILVKTYNLIKTVFILFFTVTKTFKNLQIHEIRNDFSMHLKAAWGKAKII